MEYLDSLEKNQAKECVKQEHVQARQQEQLSLRGRAQQDVYEPLITVCRGDSCHYMFTPADSPKGVLCHVVPSMTG